MRRRVVDVEVGNIRLVSALKFSATNVTYSATSTESIISTCTEGQALEPTRSEWLAPTQIPTTGGSGGLTGCSVRSLFRFLIHLFDALFAVDLLSSSTLTHFSDVLEFFVREVLDSHERVMSRTYANKLI